MRKRAFAVLLTVMLGLAGVLSPAFCALAEETDEKGILEQGAEIGEDLYRKVDEAVSDADKESLRKQVREALQQMDEMGISPTVLAENLFGIKPGSGSKMGENALIKDAEKRVRKSTEGFFTVLWEGFLDVLGDMVEGGLSIFGSKGESR